MRTKNHQHILAFLLLLVPLTGRLSGQTNGPPARVAIIFEAGEFSAVADLLTVELSAKPHLQVLEREQIEKVYREQGLSAANRDYVKLGQVLGADGLLIAGSFKEGTNEFLGVRLVAVKPGVIIGAVRSTWPVTDVAQWAKWIPNHFAPLFPKLNVLVKDAIPISVVNLRSAVNAKESQELERQLTVLAIERLTRERELFVLERRRMELLSAEKEFKGMAESSFWNGSYLLDGVIDRDGYSQETVTISARLSPPNGGAIVPIEISGNRTNLSEVINRLTRRTTASLKPGTNSAPWQSADEAQKYFEEANWALKWGMIQEAQAASQSAWALGKHDMDCALARVKSYVAQVPPDTGGYGGGTFRDPDGKGFLDALTRQLSAEHMGRIAFDRRGYDLHYAYVGKLPDPRSIDRATHALGLYLDFSRTLPPNEPKADSPWCRLGVETLDAASLVLQHFHLVSDWQKPVADELVELRSLARSVAEWISRSPSVRDTYWVGDRAATHDELGHTIGDGKNIFRCKADYGCFWQERPEDCLALYRELVTSPVFAYIHESVWYRRPESPRITSWNPEERKRVTAIWRGFVQELISSTNVIVQIEGRFLQFKDTEPGAEMEAAFNALFDTIFANREAIVTNNVELLHFGWGASGLVGGWGGSRGSYTLPPETEQLRKQYFSEYRPRLDAMKEEYWAKMRERIEQSKNLAAYEKQKKYLSDNRPYEFVEFDNTFRFSKYAQTQAAELRPLLLAYKSNLTARVAGKSGLELLALRSGLGQVERVENAVKVALNPPTSPSNRIQSVTSPNIGSLTTAKPLPPPPADSATATQTVTAASPNQLAGQSPVIVLTVTRYWSPPSLEELDCNGQLEITDVRYRRSQLWIECHCGVGNELWAVFVVNSETLQTERTIEIGRYLMARRTNLARPRWELLGDFVYVSEVDHLKKYDLLRKFWMDIPVPVQGQFSFTVIGDRLYLSGKDSILEFDPKAETTKVLASCRRTPPASILDNKLAYNFPPIFGGNNNVPRVLLDGRLYAYQKDRNDWVETDVMSEYQSYPQPEMLTVRSSNEGVLIYFRPPYHINRAYLMRDRPKMEVLFEHNPNPFWGLHEQPTKAPIHWLLPDGFTPSELPMDWDGNSLWLSAAPNSRAAPDHLWYFGEKQSVPIPIPLRFQLQVKHLGQPQFQTDDFALARLRSTPAGLVLVGRAKTGNDPKRVQVVNGSVITHGSDALAVRGSTAIVLDSIPQACFISQADLNHAVEQTIKERTTQDK